MSVRRVFWFGLLAGLCGIGVSGETLAASVEDSFEYDWYEVEFFVFERTEVMEHNTDEALVLHAPRQLPLRMVAAVPGAEGYEAYYSVDALTRLCLTFPTVAPMSSFGDAQSLLNPLSETVVEEPTSEPAQAISLVEPVATEPEAPPDPRARLLEEIAEFEAQLLATSQQWLSEDSLQLSREARRVERTGTGRLLFHGRWRQPVPARSTPEPLLLRAGESLSPLLDTVELVGTVGVTLGRYLHFQANLFFHAPVLDGTPIAVAQSGTGERIELVPQVADTGGYMRLAESRRVRSGEVHYLDHPKLGVVVRIDPVLVPDRLVEAFNSLE